MHIFVKDSFTMISLDLDVNDYCCSDMVQVHVVWNAKEVDLMGSVAVAMSFSSHLPTANGGGQLHLM